MKNFVENIKALAKQNACFREVLATGSYGQVDMMCIPTGEETGMQVHEHSDQIMIVQDGSGVLIVDGVKRLFREDDLVLIEKDLNHNVINNGKKDMKIISVYTHPEFLHKTKHKTRQDADEESMEQDEDFD